MVNLPLFASIGWRGPSAEHSLEGAMSAGVRCDDDRHLAPWPGGGRAGRGGARIKPGHLPVHAPGGALN